MTKPVLLTIACAYIAAGLFAVAATNQRSNSYAETERALAYACGYADGTRNAIVDQHPSRLTVEDCKKYAAEAVRNGFALATAASKGE